MIDVVVVQLQERGEVIIRLPQGAQAPIGGMQLAGIAGPGSGHVEKRIAVFIVRGQTYRQLVGQGNIHRAANAHIRVIADLALDPSAKLIQRGIRLVDKNGAAGRILTGKRALRSA